MIFGIKTKKDKRIEYLENLVMAQTYKHPTIIQQDKKVQRLGVSVILEPDMPISYAKRIATTNLMNEIEGNIYFEVEDDNRGNRILKGYLNVIRER